MSWLFISGNCITAWFQEKPCLIMEESTQLLLHVIKLVAMLTGYGIRFVHTVVLHDPDCHP